MWRHPHSPCSSLCPVDFHRCARLWVLKDEKGEGLSRTVELAAPLDVAELQLELDVLLEQLVLRAAADRLAEQLARGIQPLLADLVVQAGASRWGAVRAWYGEESFMPFISMVRKAGSSFSAASWRSAWCTVAVLPVPGVPDR